ncbi:Mu transposase C-terminal domain-containing protein [Nonomuraea sp. H19]|uniref:Mu transposase C-terminal domain-containing protein n=1 Tax=Nonomuraea sp. H19 TaxID=3452206 RepID=UPI003F8C2C18
MGEESAGGRTVGEKADYLRKVAVQRLIFLDRTGELKPENIKAVAELLGKHVRTVQRYVRLARLEGRYESLQRPSLALNEDLLKRYAYWQGNVSAVHRELVSQSEHGGPQPPSLSTLQRAFRDGLTTGERAAIRVGEKALREHSVYFGRPAEHRNAVWETDHVEVPVYVEVEGKLRKPWITWFIDAGKNVICGMAVTPGVPSREGILVALRVALLCDDPDMPFGGIPARVRMDRGKDFLSKAVTEALQRFAVIVDVQPGYHPHLKGTVENLNGSAEKMFFCSLPRYTHAPKQLNGKPMEPEQPPLTIKEFVTKLREWIHQWNFEHRVEGVNKTPAQLWEEDPTPIYEVSPDDLRMLTMEDEKETRKITKKGIRRKNRYYVNDWMQGRVGLQVRLRVMPYHDREIEVFEAATERYLGSAYLSDEASPEEIADMKRARAQERRRMMKVFKDSGQARRERRERLGAVSEPEEPRHLNAVTSSEARATIRRIDDDEMVALAIPIPCLASDIPDDWVVPGTARAARLKRAEGEPPSSQ